MMPNPTFFTLAYVDPGSGSMFLQILWTVILGAGIGFRKGLADLWRKVMVRKRTL